MEPKHDQIALRAELGALGLLAGLGLWSLSEFVFGKLGAPRLELAISASALGYFSAALLLAGPVSMGRTLIWAALPGSIPAALLVWASLRYEHADALAEDPFALLAYFVLLLIPLPFLVAADRRNWRDYTVLFNEAWRFVIRAVSGAIFLGVFWGVYFICNLLLSLVGLDVLDRFLDWEAGVHALSGLVLGIALAVLYDLRAYLSPVLVLRLLRLLLVPVTIVVAIFAVRVPIEGIDQVFSGLSAAATLLAMTFGLATLITSALDCEAESSDMSFWLSGTIQLACLLMPILAALGSYALWLRVEAFGWTPERVAAACFCAMALTYGVLYSVPVLLRMNWDSAIRTANRWAALIAMTLAALALTPVLDPTRIASQSQLARFADGSTEVVDLPIADMAQRWGVAGQSALDQAALLGDRDVQILLEDAQRQPLATIPRLETPQQARRSLAESMPLVPAGAAWPPELWDALPADTVQSWLDKCRAGPDRCVAILGEAAPNWEGEEVTVLLAHNPRSVSTVFLGQGPDGEVVIRRSGVRETDGAQDLIRAARTGAFAFEVPDRAALHVGGLSFYADIE